MKSRYFMSNLAKSCHLRLAPFTSLDNFLESLLEIHKFVGRIRQIGLVINNIILAFSYSAKK